MNLSAAHEAGNIIISISDDGAGINPEKVLAKARERGIVGPDEHLSIEEINHLIFKPGFSTADVVSDVSGRGVGMDVVRRNIQDLGGRVEVESEFGRGSTIRIRLPLTMAILDGQLVRVRSETYIVPLLNIIESVVIDMTKVNTLSNNATVYQLREQNIPIVRLDKVLSMPRYVQGDDETGDLKDMILVVVDLGNEQVGLVVNELLDQQQVVIKSLETNYRQLDGLSGATILGDGAVALILDLAGLVNQCYRSKGATSKTTGKRAALN
jgi:two-component system chemotaxis sensor kinase CheA